MIGMFVWCMSPILAHFGPQFFRVSAGNRDEFSTLILMTGVSWGLCIMLHMFLSALDGFQRFDLTSRIAVMQVVLRSAGYFIALQQGLGLVAMAWIFIGTQIFGYILYFFLFRHAFPELRFSRASVKWSRRPVTGNANTTTGYTPSWPSRRARPGARSGCATASNPRAPTPRRFRAGFVTTGSRH